MNTATPSIRPALAVFVTFMASGCINMEEPPGPGPPDLSDPFVRSILDPFDYPSEPGAMEYTFIRIEQKQLSGPDPTYEGDIEFDHCIHNPNDFDVQYSSGWNVYQIMGPPNAGELDLVEQEISHNSTIGDNVTSRARFSYHHVYSNETVAGRSTNYRIHLWQEILLAPDEPVHRVDRWFNMTFVPYGPGDTTHEEGEPCW